MSRIGKKSIVVPSGVEIKVDNHLVAVKGPKGDLKQTIPDFLSIKTEDDQLKMSVKNPKIKQERSSWGTFNRLIFNMIKGVSEGFEKKLELVGVGYRAQIDGDKLTLKLGFSHPVNFLIPPGIEIKVEQNIITINGIDKQLVGETAAQIRRFKKPEPYKGKGIKYVDEIIRRKAGKRATTGAA
ncbi:50S ribosomal protein L6 [Patescibacteria group bacterium]|nr:50S ribosomal protein L6 [Patescibacteria group bacterium]